MIQVDKIMAISQATKSINSHQHANNFKAILEQKRSVLTPNHPQVPTDASLGFKNVVNSMIDNHEQATKTVKTFMTRTDYSPDKLLMVQYKTGMLLLREQMFCKTAELSANTFKSFTQMQL